MEIRAPTDEYRRVLQAAVDGDKSYLECVSSKELIQKARCVTGCTALHYAAGANQLSVIEYLVREKGLCVDVTATKKAKGRTPLHYSCRNGCLEAAQLLVQLGANIDSKAKHGVTPFQLAVWQNRLAICKWLVEENGVDPSQVNEFDCGAVHWIGIAPYNRANEESDNLSGNNDGRALLPLAEWLAQQPGCNFRSKQRQGHTALHKAAWGGHIALIGYLHAQHGMYDDCQDYAGNFAADLADMANTERHDLVAKYLREHCSRARAESCAILGVSEGASEIDIRKAYLAMARKLHPDRVKQDDRNINNDEFDKVKSAYQHLLVEEGRGNQSNPAHSLRLMLQVCGTSPVEQKNDDCFKARLVAVLLEYGDKGLDVSNLRKKWKQVWPDTPFPAYDSGPRKIPLSKWVMQEAGDSVELLTDDKGSIRLLAKQCTQARVAEAAAQAEEERVT